MRKRFFFLLVACFMIYMLTHPAQSLAGAALGLSLWYRQVLPVLLPFSILSNIIVDSSAAETFFRRVRLPFLRKTGLSPSGIYPLAAGFLLGFPMGSKISADLWRKGKLGKKEFQIVSSMANNISPAFVNGFLICQILASARWTFPVFFMLYGPPILWGFVLLKKNAGRRAPYGLPDGNKKTASGSHINSKIIDAAVMNGIRTITGLGCYIMLFGIIAQAVTDLPFRGEILHAILIGATEITNGIQSISSLSLPFEGRLILLIVITQFGGACGLAQTVSLTRGTPFDTGFYLKFKCVCVISSVLLACVCIFL